MSIRIIKAGIADSLQDQGRFGYQQLGINPTGMMDPFAGRIVNMLVGNDPSVAVIEMFFPAATIHFEQETIIALGGADFSASINGDAIPLWHPVIVCRNSILQFHKLRSGVVSYLAIKGGLKISPWLNSYSTNIKAAAGGFKGISLQKDDVIALNQQLHLKEKLADKDFIVLSWNAGINYYDIDSGKILVLQGIEWDYLRKDSKEMFLNQPFSISRAADKMGFRLKGNNLLSDTKEELLSSPVCYGTIQLLPDGQLIILMADHQTTGGYPRVAQVITADLPKVAQMRPGNVIQFRLTDQHTAEQLLLKQNLHLQQLQNACTFKLESYLHGL